MDLFLNKDKTLGYKSKSQKVRVMTESCAKENIFCPSCGNHIENYPNNSKVADFYCNLCKEDYELKSKSAKSIGKVVPDGAYDSMIERLNSLSNPNFFFLTYNNEYKILNFLIIPKFFIRPENIIKAPRKLKDRGEYMMCNISLSNIPDSGKIFFIRNGETLEKYSILERWRKVSFLENQKSEKRGWLLDIMGCIEKLGKTEFTLSEIYEFEGYLKTKYPNNNFIKDKIRQQLQVLRDKGYLEFIGKGRYRVL